MIHDIEQLKEENERLAKRNALLVAEIETVRDERDDARRQYCLGFTDFCPNPAHDHLSLEEAAAQAAKSFGWNCFKENP